MNTRMFIAVCITYPISPPINMRRCAASCSVSWAPRIEEEILFTTGTTQGINLVAYAWLSR